MATNPSYKHFIITLFNLKIWKVDKTQTSTQTSEWLEKRFALFESYCIPSIKNQTCKNFIWLCLLDKDTPESFRCRIEEYKKEIPQLHACYFSAEEASHYTDDDNYKRCRFIRDTVRAKLEGEDFVITSNLDNDDAIHQEFVRRVQQEFLSYPKETLVSFKRGIQYFVSNNAVVRMFYPHNHFLNLIERTNKDFCTVEFYGHAHARKVLPNIDILEKPYWMEVVHGNNVSNELRITSRVKYLPQLATFHFSNYGIQKTLPFVTNLYNFLFCLPRYFFKIAIWRLRKKLGKGQWENT